MRKLIAFLLFICLLSGCALAETRRVYRAGEKEPFAADAETFDLYVCPLLGADCMVLMCGGKTMLVDMGKANDYDTIRGVLNDLGISRIDIAFNSHPHTDHLGSMIQILRDDPVGRFITAFAADYTAEDVIQRSTMKALAEAGVPVFTVDDGDCFSLGDAKFTVIRQTRYMYTEPNPNPFSAMLMMEYGDCRLLFCADVVQDAQLYIAQTHDLRTDIFKYPHHGLNKLYREMLDNMQAEYCFFCHGYMDTQEAQRQMDQYGIAYDFATWGVIHLSTDGNYWLVDQTLNEMGERCVKKYR